MPAARAMPVSATIPKVITMDMGHLQVAEFAAGTYSHQSDLSTVEF